MPFVSPYASISFLFKQLMTYNFHFEEMHGQETKSMTLHPFGTLRTLPEGKLYSELLGNFPDLQNDTQMSK